VQVDGARLQGRLGFVRLRDGVPEQLRLAGGTSLQAGGRELQGSGALRGTVTATRRRESGQAMDALITNLPVASLPEVVGLWAIVIDGAGFHHGHRITGVESDAAANAILQVAEDPGYEITSEGGKQVYFPGREWQSESTVEISTLARWSTD